jgi:hypothetical protein
MKKITQNFDMDHYLNVCDLIIELSEDLKDIKNQQLKNDSMKLKFISENLSGNIKNLREEKKRYTDLIIEFMSLEDIEKAIYKGYIFSLTRKTVKKKILTDEKIEEVEEMLLGKLCPSLVWEIVRNLREAQEVTTINLVVRKIPKKKLNVN